MSIACSAGPATTTPARAPKSIRRTITIDGHRRDGIRGPIRLIGAGRDLATTASQTHVIGSAEFVLDIISDADYEINSIDSHPDLGLGSVLTSTSARKGLRRRVGALGDDADPSAQLLVAMLDDIPIAAGLSRLSMIHDAARVPVSIGRRRDPVSTGHPIDICAGWVADSTMRASAEAGKAPLLHDGVPADNIGSDDADSWHPVPPMVPNGYRRWRRVDVGSRDDKAVVGLDCFFRDSYVDGAGLERIEHEYCVTVDVDRATLTIIDCFAVAGVLPSSDCENAVPSARSLIGSTIDDAKWISRRDLIGAHACTHLTDTLVSLMSVADLVRQLDGVEQLD